MSIASELVQMLKPYYWVNLLLSVSYIFCKRTPGVCTLVFPGSDCELSGRETEILFFLLVVVALRSRKAGSLTMLGYLTSAFTYTKMANLVLWFYADVRAGLVYGVLVVLCGLLLPQPTYQGPESVVYFRGLPSLREELSRAPHVTWLVCCYAAWHPACVQLAPLFSQLSHKYTLPNLRFGKADVGRYPEVARQYGIMDGATSRQLPTLLLLQRAVETERRPRPDSSGKLIKFSFSEENVMTAFELPRLYKECQELLSAKDNTDKANVKDKKQQ